VSHEQTAAFGKCVMQQLWLFLFCHFAFFERCVGMQILPFLASLQRNESDETSPDRGCQGGADETKVLGNMAQVRPSRNTGHVCSIHVVSLERVALCFGKFQFFQTTRSSLCFDLFGAKRRNPCFRTFSTIGGIHC